MHKQYIQLFITIVISLVLGIFIGMYYKSFQLQQALSSFSEELSDTSIVQPEVDSEDIVYVKKQVGEEVALATLKFVINSVTEETVISGGFGAPVVANNNAKFVLINADITNTTNQGYTFYSRDGFLLIDSTGREFSAFDNAIGNVRNYFDGRNMAPGITENGILVYEVPQDALQYDFVIGKAGTNEVYRVQLQ